MKKTLAKSAVLGGIAVFIWGLISWMILPWHQMNINKFDNERDVALTLQNNAPVSGAYILPNLFRLEKPMSQTEKMRASSEQRSTMNKEEQHRMLMQGKERMMAGPFIFAVVKKDGVNPNSSGAYIGALVLQIIAAAIVTWMLLMTKAMSYMKSVWFCTAAGLFAGVVAQLPHWVWMGFPCGLVLVSFIDLIIAWFIGGLVIAKMARK